MAQKPLPPKETLLQCMSLAGSSIEGAEYFAQQFRQLLIDTKMLKECQDIMDKVNEYAEFVRHKLTANTQPWLGEQRYLTDFQNMQENLASAAAQKLSGQIDNSINLDIAFGSSGQLLRGYSAADGSALPSEQIASLDTLLTAWFAKQNKLSKDGTIYEIDYDGELITAANGAQVHANREDLIKKMMSEDAGFKTYMQEKGVNIAVQLHDYPEEYSVPETVQSVEQVSQAAKQPVAEKTNEIEPTISPSGGMSAGS
ncbi:hypothetical protein [Legionella worsleiensis]|uniref:Substrate of the Dot/Icm secretion system n=1 Tax=Legionella worsleiensis TaxID=45076 RepID=A0A0W1AJM2_9GAMM|nr:hypothetical protein [Legionella worsleiensis]KTD81481.1 substrate of the Dot/Icm secretion system [Legionella worsleiensis]STY32040.1 Dot/Icm secretion system substrate [Legionella worsleiensis]